MLVDSFEGTCGRLEPRRRPIGFKLRKHVINKKTYEWKDTIHFSHSKSTCDGFLTVPSTLLGGPFCCCLLIQASRFAFELSRPVFAVPCASKSLFSQSFPLTYMYIYG